MRVLVQADSVHMRYSPTPRVLTQQWRREQRATTSSSVAIKPAGVPAAERICTPAQQAAMRASR